MRKHPVEQEFPTFQISLLPFEHGGNLLAEVAEKLALASEILSSFYYQLPFLQSLLTFISRAFLSRALSILHSSAMHLSRLVALRWYSSSYCFWLSCQGENRLSKEPETQPHHEAARVLL